MLEFVWPKIKNSNNIDIGLVIGTFNRPNYVRQTFDSLMQSCLEKVIVAVIDDGSDSQETIQLVRELTLGTVPIIKIFKQTHRGFGIHYSLRFGWDILTQIYKCKYLTNLDSDTLVRPDWLSKLRSLFERERAQQGPLLLTGFHTNTHKVLEVTDDYYRKKSIGGINTFFDRDSYRDVIHDNLQYDNLTQTGWDWWVMQALNDKKYPIICTRPSVIQHIGKVGFFSDGQAIFDVAEDFEPVHE